MLGGKAFRIALLVSIAAHTAVLAPWPQLDSMFEEAKPPEEKPIEVSYLEIKIIPKLTVEEQPPEPAPIKVDIPSPPEEPVAEQAVEVTRKAEKSFTVVKTEPEEVESKEKESQEAKEPESPERKIAYMGYYDLIREKIKYTLSEMYQPRHREGEIYVEFTLRTNGELKDSRVEEDRSTQSRELKELTLKALRKSAPFPPFPQELNDPQINFNVVISFRK